MLWKRCGSVELLVEDTYRRVLHPDRPFLGKLLESRRREKPVQ